MAFKFTLRAVLRCRESFEHRERQRLQVITRELVRSQRQKEQVLRNRAAAQQELKQRLSQGLSAVELQYEQATDRVRVRQIASLNEHIGKMIHLRRRQIEVFQKAQQQRKVIENIRDRQLSAYRLLQARKEQQQMDDRYLLTHPTFSTRG
jgi:flagellar protein FliJ